MTDKYTEPYSPAATNSIGGPLNINTVEHNNIATATTYMANEMAEANRLKKLELRILAMRIQLETSLSVASQEILSNIVKEIDSSE